MRAKMKAVNTFLLLAAVSMVYLEGSIARAAATCRFALDLSTPESVFYLNSAFKKQVKIVVKRTYEDVHKCWSPDETATSCLSYSTPAKTVKQCKIHLGFNCILEKEGLCTSLDTQLLIGKAVKAVPANATINAVTVEPTTTWASSLRADGDKHILVGVHEEPLHVAM